MCWWRLWAGGSATAERRSGIAIPSRGQPKDPQEALSPALHLVALHCRHISHDNNDNNSNIKPTFSANRHHVRMRHLAKTAPLWPGGLVVIQAWINHALALPYCPTSSNECKDRLCKVAVAAENRLHMAQ